MTQRTEAVDDDIDRVAVTKFLEWFEREEFALIAQALDQPETPKSARWLTASGHADVFKKMLAGLIALEGELGRVRAAELVEYVATVTLAPTPSERVN